LSDDQQTTHFRFEQFADAPSAQAAFEAAFPPGSPAEPALQVLLNMGTQCKTVGTGKIACRYVEQPTGLAGWCWHVSVDANSDKVIQSVSVTLAMTGI
jgi:hypothetical protein